LVRQGCSAKNNKAAATVQTKAEIFQVSPRVPEEFASAVEAEAAVAALYEPAATSSEQITMPAAMLRRTPSPREETSNHWLC
jgi:hypothetical protein